VRKRVTAVGHNGLKTVINLFNTYNPKWEILPRGPADKDKAEELERWLEWQMSQANLKEGKESFKVMLKSSAKKGVIAAQLDYLPYWLTEDTKERKNLLMNGAFCINVVEPDNIHYEIGKYGIRWVASVSNVTGSYILDHWEQYEAGDKEVKSALDKVRGIIEDEGEETHFVYVDYTDKDKRWVFFFETENETCTSDELELEEGEEVTNILNRKNELPFINWVITENSGDPIFMSMHKSGSYENTNFFKTLSDSTVIRRAYFPILEHNSPTGESLEVDFSGPDAIAETKAGEVLRVLQPPQLDPGIRELEGKSEADMSGDLGVRGLQQTDVTGNVQFATVNAQLQLGKTVLDPAIRAFERACVLLGKLAFAWVSYQGDTVTAYRTNKKKPGYGNKINVSPKDYDPDTLMITCELLANTPTDDMQRWNMFSGMLQAGLHVPQKEFIERLELGDPDTLEEKWLDEQAMNLAWQLFSQAKQMELQQKQVEMQQQAQAQQQAMMQAQANAQPQGQSPAPQGPGAAPGFDQTQGTGFDQSQGGSSPQVAAGMTQTAGR
jgi:hypothetical protein